MITISDINNRTERFYAQNPLYDDSGISQMNYISQYKFLRELDPRGHLILDPRWYKDIWKEVPVDEKDEKKGTTWARKAVERVTIPLQRTIKTKRLTYLYGNGMFFDIMELNPTENQQNAYISFKQKWLLYQFDTAMYEFLNSVSCTGDAAINIYKDNNGETNYKVFSILNNDRLHPIFDYTGKLRLFGRTFSDKNSFTKNVNSLMEIWDDVNYYLFSSDINMWDKNIKVPQWDELKNFGVENTKQSLSQYYPVIKKAHGRKQVPIIYCKNELGACWTPVQYLIDNLEIALSQFFENNKSYAFRIMYIQGGFVIQGELRDNAKEPRAILLDDPNAKVGFAEGADASGAFKEQLQQTLDLIKMGGFIVMPPQTLSGDTSGTAIKILYAPAIEQTMNDIHFYNPYIKEIVSLFKEYISTEENMSPSDLNTIHIRPYLTPYIPQNDQEVVNNLSVAHGAGYLSAETCQERDPNSTPQEAMRVKQEADELAETERNAIVNSSSNDSTIIDENDNLNKGAMNAQNLQKRVLSVNNKK